MRMSLAAARLAGLIVKAGKRAKKIKAPLRGQPRQTINLVLPWPPMGNNLYPTVQGRRVLSSAGKKYKQAVALACMESDCGHIPGRFVIEIWAYPPDERKCDLSNIWKIVLDSLVDSGVIEDDSLSVTETIHRASVDCIGEGRGRLIVKIMVPTEYVAAQPMAPGGACPTYTYDTGMRKKNDTVPCGHCKGTGKIALTGIYADTLALLRAQGGSEISGAALAKIAVCEATAMNNRLAALEEMGFATSRRYGRLRLYKAVK